MKRLFRTLIEPERHNLPDSEAEGISRVCSSRYAHVTAQHNVHLIPGCRLATLPDEYFPTSLAMGLTKNSPYKGIIDYKYVFHLSPTSLGKGHKCILYGDIYN